jgi:hypothetical protein
MRNRLLRKAAGLSLDIIGKVLTPGLARDIYWHYAFVKKFPDVHVSLPTLQACYDRARQSRAGSWAKIQNSKGTTLPGKSDDVPTYCEMLVTDEDEVYEFANHPTDKRHCLWPNITLLPEL